MKNYQSKRLYPSALLQSGWKSVLLLTLVCLLTLTASCSDDDDTNNVPMLKGKITSYNEFGAAMLDFTEADMTEAGFTLGDVISISIDDKEIIMPYYDGFYTRNGEYLCVAYPTYPSICFTANNIGLPKELTGLEGHSVVVKMVEKGGRLDVQTALSMSYTIDREDYPNFSDTEFANARASKGGRLASGVLHRSSSPFCNDINRAFYVSEYLKREKVRTVLNLADTEEKMKSYDMPPYSRTLWEEGNVILCPLKADPTADDYNNRLIGALKELPLRPAPYVVHCMEGKDRTGYVCALLEGLCGATYEEIVADYLITYNNYYLITPENDRILCNTLVSLRLNTCLMYYAGVNDEAQLPSVDYAKAFSSYLLTHGMSQQQIDALVQALTVRN
ncbi:MAG: tyrosine-protein phosphatase [Prevotella sp.]|nr:tyrosine-protein phosphatase [Prevotella sp.]MBR4240366.1 tyrosine-protein phosphatase [Prevotella sp.]